MKRIFEFLLPERTHLKAVIAALIAIFLLSGVLAYQVHKSETARIALENKHIESNQQVAANALRDNFEHGIWGSLHAVFMPAVGVAKKGGDPEEVADSVSIQGFCSGCSATAHVGRAQFVDLTSVSSNAAVPAEVLRFVANADTSRIFPIDAAWSTGIQSFGSSGRARIFAYLRNKKEGVNRAWFVELPKDYLSFATSYVASNEYLPVSYTHGLALSAVFRVEASHPHFGKLVRTSAAEFAATPVVDRMTGAAFPGLTWTAGLTPQGRRELVPPLSPWQSPNLLIALMILIAAVIAMAIALVRREEELHRLRSDLISGVSHELRTPLAQIRMFAETLLLGRTRTEAERRRSLEVIDQEAKRLSHFVENMLQFAKGEGGRARLAPEPTSFAIEVRRAVESFAPMCQARGVDVRTELEDGVTAPVDRAALRRIMLNLMENALKYGPDEQRITVGTAIFNDVVRLWVDDEGEGIPRADRERVFDSFYRLNRDLDRRVTGSGIGLAVVRQLATLHGGRAWAEEAPGGGARLVVEFPDAYVRKQEDGAGWAVA